MSDSTTKKVSVSTSPKGAMGQTYLVSGKRVAMQLWDSEQPQLGASDRRDYETVGFVLNGLAELTLEGQTIQPGDSWLVPAGRSIATAGAGLWARQGPIVEADSVEHAGRKAQGSHHR